MGNRYSRSGSPHDRLCCKRQANLAKNGYETLKTYCHGAVTAKQPTLFLFNDFWTHLRLNIARQSGSMASEPAREGELRPQLHVGRSTYAPEPAAHAFPLFSPKVATPHDPTRSVRVPERCQCAGWLVKLLIIAPAAGAYLNTCIRVRALSSEGGDIRFMIWPA